MMHHAFSRRQFLKAGGAAALSTAAAGLLSSCGGSVAGGTAATGDSATYTVQADDVGYSIYVWAEGTGNTTGSATSKITSEVKAN